MPPHSSAARPAASWPALATSVAAHAALLGLTLAWSGAAGEGGGAERSTVAFGPAAPSPVVSETVELLPTDAPPAASEPPRPAPVADDFPLPLPAPAALPAQPRWLKSPPRAARATLTVAEAVTSSPEIGAPEAAVHPDAPFADAAPRQLVPPPRTPPSVDPAACPAPEYPRRALRRGWEGTVWLLLEVGADGRPTAVTLEQSSGHADLDAAALEAARAWRLLPAREGSTAVAGALRVPVRFRLAPPA